MTNSLARLLVEESPVAAQDIEYVEIYTSDEQSAVEYFVSSFGFVQMANPTRHCYGRGLCSS
jgi:4-hydroxyphenylpyruvate dioxygenase-like putative hemolysin